MDPNEISLIYQDHHLLIVNKPPGVVIHPTYKHADGTMWDALLLYLAQQNDEEWQPQHLPDEPAWARAPEHIREMLRMKRLERECKENGLLPRPCLLHRLDKDTSGIVALARTERSRRHLIRQFHEHTIVKRYLAVVQKGSPAWSQPRTTFNVARRQQGNSEFQVNGSFDQLTSGDELRLDGPLQRDPDDRRRCIVGPQGQEAITMLNVMSIEGEFAFLEVYPITGRTHQIRAHLAALGYGIVGDQTYAFPAESGRAEATLKRQFLHAYSLELNKYPDNTRCTFIAPLAYDLVYWMERYFQRGLNIVDVRNTLPS